MDLGKNTHLCCLRGLWILFVSCSRLRMIHDESLTAGIGTGPSIAHFSRSVASRVEKPVVWMLSERR